jgi:hypothetical protein
MVGVDSADRTKEMLCFTRIESVAGQLVLARNKSKPAHGRWNRDRAAHPAIGTGASADGVKTIAELDSKPHCSTVALTALHALATP